MKKSTLLACGMFAIYSTGLTQISEGGLPTSFQADKFDNPDIFKQDYQVHELISPDMETVYQEDAVSSEKGQAYRVGVNIPVSYSIMNSGSWLELPNGDRLWRLGIHIPDAQALSLYFSEKVKIPQGGRLHAYNERHSQYVGAYTASTPSFYAMEMIQGDLITLEYYMPAGSNALPVIEISEVAYYYRGVESGIAIFRDGEVISQDRTHGSCEVDAMCSEADNWSDQRRSAVRYTFVDGGTFLCSGAVVNNTNKDCTPYILTANHCGEPTSSTDINNHIWYFNYQRPTCTPGNTGHYSGATSQTMSGGIFRASSSLGSHPGTGSEVDGCDFVLVELEDPIPTFYHAYYAGWNRASGGASSGVCFHHPAGDEKKISTYQTSLTNATYNGGWSNAHWKVQWAATDNGHGVTEGGSSGSAILDQNGLIVGHLSGGASFCSTPTEYDLYGKFRNAWDLDGNTNASQLKPWLDPGGSDSTSIQGTYGSCGIVSVPEIAEASPTISVYPNPTSAVLTLDLTSLSQSVTNVQVFDATGRLVFETGAVQNDKLQLTLEESGVYFIQVTTASGVWAQRVQKI